MKGLNINIPSCTSEDSTAIMEYPSSSSSTSSSTTTIGGGRAIDRHNPIITDEKRSGFSNSSCTNTPIRTPLTNNILQKKPVIISPKPLKKTKKSSKRNITSAASATKSAEKIINDDHRSFSKPSDLMMKAAACSNSRPGVDYINPPESSRYLLDDTSFLEVLSDFDPVLKLLPSNNDVGLLKSQTSRPPKPSSSSGPSEQVVVLRVSLHCRGCERKMKKHLSRMPGVKSFNIDFAAKKVTVVGDVTPLGVLASISKVKTAQLWTPAQQTMQLKK